MVIRNKIYSTFFFICIIICKIANFITESNTIVITIACMESGSKRRSIGIKNGFVVVPLLSQD